MDELESHRNLKRKKVDLLVFSQEPEVIERAKDVAMQFRFIIEIFKLAEDYVARASDYGKPTVIVMSNPREASDLKTICPRASFFLVAENPGSTLERKQQRADGFEFILTKHEFLRTPKFEFLTLQKIRAAYYAISLQDVYPSTEMTFHASVRLPLNQKYLPVVFKGFVLTELKFAKIEKEGRLFIKNLDSADYLNYLKYYNDGFGAGMKKRCRGLFLLLNYELLAVYEVLLLDTGRDQRAELLIRYTALERTLKEINDYLSQPEGVDLWEVFRDALVNEIFNHWRAAWHVVYAGLICNETKRGDALTAMRAACFADIGLTDLTSEIFFHFVHEGEEKLNPDQVRELRKHPILSLNRCLGHELPLSDAVKAILVCTHERADQKGYPNQTPPAMIPFEAWAIEFAERLDLGVRLLALDSSVAFKFLRRVIWERHATSEGAFPVDVVASFEACTL